jgi:hypothetical protein
LAHSEENIKYGCIIKIMVSTNNPIKSFVMPIALVTAVLYNIWPLGYLLDPGVLHNSYISVLEVSGKPYSKLFMFADILTGAMVVILGLVIRKLNTSSNSVVFSYIVFGLATIMEAVIPISSRCVETVSSCGTSLSQVLTLHDIASILAAFSLFYSLYMLKRLVRQHKPNSTIYKYVSLNYWIWCLTGPLLIISVVVDSFAILSQALFLLTCGYALIVIPTTLVKIKE